MPYDMKNVPANSGRILGEDGEVYNLVDLLKGVGGGNVNPDDFYTKEEVDSRLNQKANSSSLSSKADKSALEELSKTVDALKAEIEALKGE